MEVKIEKQDHYGRGIARVEEKVTFLKNALPGEVCKIELETCKKSFATGRVTEIVTESKERVTPLCPYYEVCGGCDLQHQNRRAQLQFKKQKVEELIEKFAHRKIEITDILFGADYGYRNKVTLHGKNGQLGLYEEKSNRLLALDQCLLLKPELNALWQDLIHYIAEHPKDTIESAVLRATSMGTMIWITGHVDHEALKSFFSKKVTTLLVKNQVLLGTGTIEETILSQKFQVSPTSFFQVNDEMRDQMYQLVLDYTKKKKRKRILDLYCGTGTIGLILAPYASEVIGIDCEKSSIADAKENQKKNHLSNVTFLCDKVENRISDLREIDFLVVDPPRSGLDQKTRENIRRIAPSEWIYISCDPATLARDLTDFLDCWDIAHITLIDMFPNTHHVECCVFFTQKQ